jgi:hypothetical protein
LQLHEHFIERLAGMTENPLRKCGKKLEKLKSWIRWLKIKTGFDDEQSDMQQARAKHSKNHEDSYLALGTKLNQAESTVGEEK